MYLSTGLWIIYDVASNQIARVASESTTLEGYHCQMIVAPSGEVVERNMIIESGDYLVSQAIEYDLFILWDDAGSFDT